MSEDDLLSALGRAWLCLLCVMVAASATIALALHDQHMLATISAFWCVYACCKFSDAAKQMPDANDIP